MAVLWARACGRGTPQRGESPAPGRPRCARLDSEKTLAGDLPGQEKLGARRRAVKLRAEVRRVDELQANADRSDAADRRARQERAVAQAAHDRAYAECQYQSDAALTGTRNFVDRVVEGSSLISQCMRLKGYQ